MVVEWELGLEGWDGKGWDGGMIGRRGRVGAIPGIDESGAINPAVWQGTCGAARAASDRRMTRATVINPGLGAAVAATNPLPGTTTRLRGLARCLDQRM